MEVPYISQKGSYPTGCESVSTVMLLQHLGFDMSVDDFIGRYLRQRPFETKDGILYGADPRKEFCGSPYREDGFGCYAPVIEETLNRIFEEADAPWEAVDASGATVEELCHRYLDHGMPVICWTCIDLREPIVGPSWKLLDNGEDFTWISNEHCLLLVGYDEEGFWCNDPYDGHGVVRYPRDVMEDRHAAQHSMAVGVRRK